MIVSSDVFSFNDWDLFFQFIFSITGIYLFIYVENT